MNKTIADYTTNIKKGVDKAGFTAYQLMTDMHKKYFQTYKPEQKYVKDPLDKMKPKLRIKDLKDTFEQFMDKYIKPKMDSYQKRNDYLERVIPNAKEKPYFTEGKNYATL